MQELAGQFFNISCNESLHLTLPQIGFLLVSVIKMGPRALNMVVELNSAHSHLMNGKQEKHHGFLFL